MVPRTSYALEVRDICNRISRPLFVSGARFNMNGRRTRNKRARKRECHADVVRMLCECCADVVRMLRGCHANVVDDDVVRIPRRSHAYVVQMRCAYARHSSSKCDVKRAGCAHYTRWTRLHSMGTCSTAEKIVYRILSKKKTLSIPASCLYPGVLHIFHMFDAWWYKFS
jgi:hypothetical protein